MAKNAFANEGRQDGARRARDQQGAVAKCFRLTSGALRHKQRRDLMKTIMPVRSRAFSLLVRAISATGTPGLLC